MEEGYYTSTIGSFPLEDSIANRERCLKDLIETGIDYPAYPQLSEMGKQFLEDLVNQNCGIYSRNGEYMLISDKIDTHVKPPGLEPFLWTTNYIKKKGLNVKIKAAITGPFTLSSYIKIDKEDSLLRTALSDITLVEQIAQIISDACGVASKEAAMISIDEPILSLIVGSRVTFKHREREIKRVLNIVRDGCGDVLTGIHVCGRIAPKLASILLETEVDFLSHEFHDTPENMKVYKPTDLKERGKILSVGCISSRKPVIESVEEILAIMKKFREYGNSLIFTPDCGFRDLVVNGSREHGYEIAIKKLKNMVKAVLIFRSLY